MQRAAFGWHRAAFNYLFFNVVYQVSSSEIEVKIPRGDERDLEANLLFFQGSQALRGQITDPFYELFRLI